ncbi:tubby-related protein 2 isoform X1 [Sesbania bispinosa]|nr:tubby-related protein 2 isoform X1 [Sesbania bispinosa]
MARLNHTCGDGGWAADRRCALEYRKTEDLHLRGEEKAAQRLLERWWCTMGKKDRTKTEAELAQWFITRWNCKRAAAMQLHGEAAEQSQQCDGANKDDWCTWVTLRRWP